MASIIGIDVLCKTAREQDILVSYRECSAYPTDAYNGSIRKRLIKIIAEYIDNCSFEISFKTHYFKDGSVLNSIIIKLYNEKGYNKKELRLKIKNYIDGHFKRKFNCS